MMKKYLTELHLHTKESSSCAKVPVIDILDAYQKAGYKTIVITDHCSKKKMNKLGDISWLEKMNFVFNGYDKALKYGSQINLNIILGVEITLQETKSDYLIFGIEKDFLIKNEYIYDYSLKKLYEICHKSGYIVIQAHPFRDNMQLAPLSLIDGIEVFNGCIKGHSRNDIAMEYGKNTHKILTSGSDFHRLEDLAIGGIMTDKEIKNAKQLIAILKSGNYNLIQNVK